MDAHALLANSKTSKNNWRYWAESQCLYDASKTFKTAKTSTDFSKIYKKSLATTWFVGDWPALLNADGATDGATDGDL